MMMKIEKECAVCEQPFIPKTVDSLYSSCGMQQCGIPQEESPKENRTKEQEDKLNMALSYTRKSFALYLSNEHLDVLCRNLQIYINELDVKELQPVKAKELTAIDLRHFGWNIWNYSKPRNQMDIAHFFENCVP